MKANYISQYLSVITPCHPVLWERVGKGKREKKERWIWTERLWENVSLLLLWAINLKLHTSSPLPPLLHHNRVPWCWNLFVEWHAHTSFTQSWTHNYRSLFLSPLLYFYLFVVFSLLLVYMLSLFFSPVDSFSLDLPSSFFLVFLHLSLFTPLSPFSYSISVILSPVLSFSSPYRPSWFRSTASPPPLVSR